MYTGIELIHDHQTKKSHNICSLAECALCGQIYITYVCAALSLSLSLSLSRGSSLTYDKMSILKVILKVIQDHQTEKIHNLCALVE